ncbi:two-component system response regulator [Maribacter sp. 2307ULW6-5]|uniref:response regulator n=1 Tax=Maribacter sp. 2307ULW6-5 TaxID=3386275 RepID=UPI0039BC8C12
MSHLKDLKSILLIDDDEASNFLHSIFVNKLNLELTVNAALNGKEGLDFILGNGAMALELPCLVLLDLRMPIMDGWEFVSMYEAKVPEHIKAQIKIVLVTVSDDQADKDRAEANVHVVDYAQKPLSDHTFKALIKKHFGRVPGPASLARP